MVGSFLIYILLTTSFLPFPEPGFFTILFWKWRRCLRVLF
jgi:hypothetical protein